MLTIVPHKSQRNENDCGLACVSMVLSGIGRQFEVDELLPAHDMDSVWTIDLCYLLRKHCQDFTMYTTYIGVNWNHSGSAFYTKSYQNDVKRVHERFAKAKDNGIRVVPVKLPMLDICRFLLSNRYAIIVLVDSKILNCHLCAEKKRKEWWGGLCCKSNWKPRNVEGSIVPPQTNPITISFAPESQSVSSSYSSTPASRRLSFGGLGSPSSISTFLPKTSPSTPLAKPVQTYNTFRQSEPPYYSFISQDFVGHYIVLIGYDKENDMFFFRDPGTDSPLCVAGFDNLENAMSSETDSDLIVVRVL